MWYQRPSIKTFSLVSTVAALRAPACASLKRSLRWLMRSCHPRESSFALARATITPFGSLASLDSSGRKSGRSQKATVNGWFLSTFPASGKSKRVPVSIRMYGQSQIPSPHITGLSVAETFSSLAAGAELKKVIPFCSSKRKRTCNPAVLTGNGRALDSSSHAPTSSRARARR